MPITGETREPDEHSANLRNISLQKTITGESTVTRWVFRVKFKLWLKKKWSQGGKASRGPCSVKLKEETNQKQAQEEATAARWHHSQRSLLHQWIRNYYRRQQGSLGTVLHFVLTQLLTMTTGRGKTARCSQKSDVQRVEQALNKKGQRHTKRPASQRII